MQDATRSTRCLTILGKLTSCELLTQLWPVLFRIAHEVSRFRRTEITPERTFEFETTVQELLREVGRLIVQWTFNHLEPEPREQMPRLFLWEGEYFRRRSKSPLRNLNCLFGPIALSRFCYQRVESCGRCLFPLEVQLGIVMGVATPALADVVGRMSSDSPQRQVLDQLRKQGITWGVRTLRKVIQAMAEVMSEHRHQAQVQSLLTWLVRAAAGKGPRRFVLSVGRDGVMLPMVKSQKYKEAAAATVSVMDRRGKRLGTVYLGQMPQAHQTTISDQLTRLLQDLLSLWKGPLPRLVYVTDCGSHPTEYFQKVLSRQVNPRAPTELLPWEWIVDYYHACQYITKLAEAIFGPGRAAISWAAKQRRVLKEKPGGVFRVLRSAGALMTIRGLAGSEDSYWSAYDFLRNRASKMNYATYRHLRLPIGSGITEAACKIVFTQRFKQSGMKWTIEGGRAILALRVIALSGVWDQVRRATLKSYSLPKPLTPELTPPRTDRILNKTVV
jgi:hypothetical protein